MMVLLGLYVIAMSLKFVIKPLPSELAAEILPNG